MVGFALRVLDGYDPRQAARHSQEILKDPSVSAVVKESLKREEAIEAKQREWLAKNEPN